MSRSSRLKDGAIPDSAAGSDEQRRYFPWGVARVVLCKIVGADLRIRENMTTEAFQETFRNLNFHQQVGFDLVQAKAVGRYAVDRENLLGAILPDLVTGEKPHTTNNLLAI